MKLHNLNCVLKEGVSYDNDSKVFSFNYDNDDAHDIIKLVPPDSGSRNIGGLEVHFGCMAVGQKAYVSDVSTVKNLKAEVNKLEEKLKKARQAKKIKLYDRIEMISSLHESIEVMQSLADKFDINIEGFENPSSKEEVVEFFNQAVEKTIEDIKSQIQSSRSGYNKKIDIIKETFSVFLTSFNRILRRDSHPQKSEFIRFTEFIIDSWNPPKKIRCNYIN